jgi:hypothetical protein
MSYYEGVTNEKFIYLEYSNIIFILVVFNGWMYRLPANSENDRTCPFSFRQHPAGFNTNASK